MDQLCGGDSARGMAQLVDKSSGRLWRVLILIGASISVVILLSISAGSASDRGSVERNRSRNVDALAVKSLSGDEIVPPKPAFDPHSSPNATASTQAHNSMRDNQSPSAAFQVQQLPLSESRPARCGGLHASDQSWQRLRCDCLAKPHAVDGILCHLSHATQLPPLQLQKLALDPVGRSAWDHTKTILSYGTRVPGDAGWSRTLGYIRWNMEELGWVVTTDDFTAATPNGHVQMQNVIATFNPSGGECIVDLAAHLDSKHFTDFLFLGASDSASSVGMMLAAAQHLTPALKSKLQQDGQLPCLRFLFFDGEEAVDTWTATDSLYGSRHLASVWKSQAPQYGFGSNMLSSIRTMVLLDLLGCPLPTLNSRFKDTLPVFERLQAVETRLRDAQLLHGGGGAGHGRYFQTNEPEMKVWPVSDDDVPFHKDGVPIVHAISVPFPAVWHKEGDNLAALDQGTVQDLALILRAAIAEIYSLQVL